MRLMAAVSYSFSSESVVVSLREFLFHRQGTFCRLWVWGRKSKPLLGK